MLISKIYCLFHLDTKFLVVPVQYQLQKFKIIAKIFYITDVVENFLKVEQTKSDQGEFKFYILHVDE